ncbi:hypothetical protein EDD18DRAFT_1185697 [Armillaria luteobubalina]|uniref:Secreted protein n=1 Tax=Armillaria luteobubalina TaxID=153913 RepID=A0AA39UPP3_9AGAR|nr:hypothetical protein EDD18DRAFT_1185697 [Armillaria luteobubalina]
MQPSLLSHCFFIPLLHVFQHSSWASVFLFHGKYRSPASRCQSCPCISAKSRRRFAARIQEPSLSPPTASKLISGSIPKPFYSRRQQSVMLGTVHTMTCEHGIAIHNIAFLENQLYMRLSVGRYVYDTSVDSFDKF